MPEATPLTMGFDRSPGGADDLDTPYREWMKDQSPAGNRKLAEALSPVIRSALRSYAGTHPEAALETQARILAVEAMKKYDPKAGTKIRTYLMHQLQPLRRAAGERRSPLNIPESVRYDATGVWAAQKELEDELGRDPTDAEVADRAGFPLKRLRHVRDFMRATAEGSMVDAEGEPIDPAIASHNAPDEWLDAVYYDLPAIDKKILEWRGGYNGHRILPVREVANRLGISEGRVSQRLGAVAARIRERPTNG